LENETRPLILIADDEPVTQKLFSLLLEKLGYNVVIAGNGEEALEKAKTTEPALAFLDIQMPKMTGFEAAGNLRALGYKKPIIAVTATFHPEYEENCRNSAINDVLVKPIKISEIQRMLEKWLIPEEGLSAARPERDPASGPEAFNAKELLYTFMNEVEIVLPLLSRFIERTKTQLDNFPVLKASGDWESARRDAHTIKGAGGTMGGAELGKAAGVLEKACLNASIEESETAYSRVLEIFAKYKKEAEEFIRERKP
jgi:CheY-like chemotaxis protein/HPt (histidine-containing phosphotransfer) domain-containing protein